VPLHQALHQAQVSAAALYDQLVAEGEIPQW